MQTPRCYAPLGCIFTPVRVAGFEWNGWQVSAICALRKMTSEIVSLILGLAGIFSTLIVSGLGIYFTAKARSSSLRESLFTQQLELVRKIIYMQGRVRVFFTVLTDRGGPYEEQAGDEAREAVREFSKLQEEGAAILPVELWVEIKHLNDVMIDVLGFYNESGEISEEDMKTYVAHATKASLLSRAVLGIDELTTEGLKLYSTEKLITSLASLEEEHFKKIHETVNEGKKQQ